MAKKFGKNRKGGKKPIMKSTAGQVPRQPIPAEVIGIIAKFLLADGSYGTCASLNVCSKAIYQETLPDLWKKLVLWPSRAHADVPDVYWSSHDTKGRLSKEQQSVEERTVRIWRHLMASPGVKWVQYIVLLPYASCFTAQNAIPIISLSMITRFFPRAKVCIDLLDMNERTPTQAPEVIVFVALFNFDFGSSDLYHLSRALLDFRDFGGANVQKVFLHHKGVDISSWKVASATLESLKESISRRKEVIRPALPFKPDKLNAGCHSRMSDLGLAQVLLELVDWVKGKVEGESGVEFNSIYQLLLNMESAAVCARAFQRAMKSDPTCSCVHLELKVRSVSSIAVGAEAIHGILAIVRGSYLLASRAIELEDMGAFTVGATDAEKGHIWGEVKPIPLENVFQTTIFGDDFSTVLYRDVCETVQRSVKPEEIHGEHELSKAMRYLRST